MSILLYKQPQALDFAGNPLFFQMKGTDYIQIQPQRANLSLKSNSVWNVKTQQFMYLSFLGRTHVFKFLSIDDQEVEPFSTDPFGNSPIDHVIRFNPSSMMTSIIDGLKSYSPLGLFYDIFVWGEGLRLLITAKISSPVYNIELILSHSISNIVSGWTKLNGIAQVNRSDYHFLCSLFVEKMSAKGTYFELPEFRIDPNDNQIAEIDIAGIVQRKFLNFFDLPDFTASDPVKTEYSKLSYYLTLREMSGNTQLGTLTTPAFYVVNGRINNADHGSFVLRDWIVSNKRFLTNAPRTTVTYADAHNLLYYLNPYAGTSAIKVKVLIAHTGGADVSYSFAIAALSQDDVVMIPVGAICAANLPTSATIIKAECWVDDAGGTLLAGKQTYVFRPKPMFGRTLLMMNGYGMFDAVTIHTQKNQLKTEAEENTLTLASGYSRYVGDKAVDFTTGEDLFTAETGPITFDMAQHIKELLALRRVVFLQAADRYIRVVIEPETTSISDDEKDLCNISFKYKPAFSGDLISQSIELPKAVHRDHSDEYIESDYL